MDVACVRNTPSKSNNLTPRDIYITFSSTDTVKTSLKFNENDGSIFYYAKSPYREEAQENKNYNAINLKQEAQLLL